MSSYRNITLPSLSIRAYGEATPFEKAITNCLNEEFRNLDGLLNRGLNFADNFDGRILSFTSSVTPDAENTVAHTLGKIPTGFIVTDINKGAVVYRGTTSFTATNIYLKCNTASTAIKVLIF